MEYNSPLPLHKLPKFSEGTPLASSRDDRSNSMLWHKVEAVARQVQDLMGNLQMTGKQVSKMKRQRYGGGFGVSGWDWMYPDHRELDTTLSYSIGKFAYVSANNSLILTGMTDIVSGITVTSCQGVWQAMQFVPAASGGAFNVPTLNYPSGAAIQGGSTFAPGTTAPSGTPLRGDLDLVDSTTGQPVLFWYYWGDITT